MHDRAPQRFKPIGVDNLTGLAHVALSLPLRCQPETTVVAGLIVQADAADALCRLFGNTDHPMPLASGCNSRECMIAHVRQRAVIRVRPGHAAVQVTDHFPMGK
ncbi:hypothetical protein D3C84_1096480 [compost metagenome]